MINLNLNKKSRSSPTIRSAIDLAAVIDSRGLQPELHRAVMDFVKIYPDGSLDYLYRNLEHVIAKCQETIGPYHKPEIIQPLHKAEKKLPPPLEKRKSLFDEDE